MMRLKHLSQWKPLWNVPLEPREISKENMQELESDSTTQTARQPEELYYLPKYQAPLKISVAFQWLLPHRNLQSRP